MNINRLVVSFLLRNPYFGYILSSLKWEESLSVETVELISGATVRMLYNPLWLEKLEEKAAFGVILHELLHLVLLHPVRRGNRDRKFWAIACDLAANEYVDREILPEGYLTVERVNREMKNRMEKYKSAEYYYEKMMDEDFGESVNLMTGQNELILRFPDDEEIGIKIPGEEELSELSSRALESTMEEITRQAAEEGEISDSLKGALNQVYSNVDVNWRNVLKKFLAARGRMEIRTTVKKASKRFVDMPGKIRQKGVEALIAIDESGSVSDSQILDFYREMTIIKRMTRARIMVTRFDTDCSDPVPLERYLKIQDREKRGGTDFRPLFQMADRRGFRFLIVFTDGDGMMPPGCCSQKVLWVLSGDKSINPPFGETVRYS